MTLIISNIIQCRLKSDQFFEQNTNKNQIYLHHTAGNGNAVGVAKYWGRNTSKVATAFIIGDDGTIVQCFSSKHWAYHLGVGDKIFKEHGIPFQDLNKHSIGIEVCNFGYLQKKDGKYVSYVGSQVRPDQVTILDKPFKGHLYWFKYTDEQIKALKDLIIYLAKTYNIPCEYSDEIWDIQESALRGEKGMYTHNSVRKDKTDMYPCPRLIEMLKTLKDEI